MEISQAVEECIHQIRRMAEVCHHAYMTPEHLLYVLCGQKSFKQAIEMCGSQVEAIQKQLMAYLDMYIDEREEGEAVESFALQELFFMATHQVASSGREVLDIEHLVAALFKLEESYALYYLEEEGITQSELLFVLCHSEEIDGMDDTDSMDVVHAEEPQKQSIEAYATNLNDYVKNYHQPIVERQDILERTLEVLCRKTKNNPIHLGEAGVGKTAITLGLAKRINAREVPKVLEDATLFSLDLGSMLAGTQYRGDFEKRVKKVLSHIEGYEKPIVYIDEIHNIVGAGALGGGSLDASNLLKPYLTDGKIRFIGSTTYDEYKKYFEKDKGLARRFQTIEVKEPSVAETLSILRGIQESFEKYHGITYTEDALEAAVQLSHLYMNDRYLPDKAIDLMDEAGAYITIHGSKTKKKVVTPKVIETILARICHIPKKTVAQDETKKLRELDKVLKQKIFGQDEAVDAMTKYIKLSRAGLSDGQKPVASVLFVGPTGVGKTEIAKCLAEELGIKLIRFDMSEYGEKHTASKLIGSPPGYVGYEEGGLLTDAIRKTPHAVLLLDEIEKAHSDVFNMLLQVMDYATLTDNQGRKADFRNIILIMTSNAGAREIGKALVGFGEREVRREAMEEEVKKVFSPEFRNRLNGVIPFNHLTEAMAKQIAEKELKHLKLQLKEKEIALSYTKHVVAYIVQEGTSKQFGAREIKRVIDNQIKPLMVDAILFGSLQKGGKCKVDVVKNQVIIHQSDKGDKQV